MDKEKQIEEMAKICHFYDDGICHLCEELLVSCDRKCDLAILVENLYNSGYRKAPDVAEEIFEEIEKYNHPPLPECEPIYIIKSSELAELKKKYTEEVK